MTILLRAFWQILLLRKSPETIPYSPFLLGIAITLHLLMGAGLGVLDQAVITSLVSALLGTGLLMGSSYLLLTIHGKRSRFIQTVTATAGCELILGVMGLPIYFWLFSVDKANAQIPALLWLMLTSWGVAVTAHIWRHALAVPKWQSFLYAIAYVIISIWLALVIQAQGG